jgi:integrase
MREIKAFIRSTVADKKANVRFRLGGGKGMQAFYASDIKVLPANWDKDKEQVKARAVIPEAERFAINKRVSDTKALLWEVYKAAPDKDKIDSDYLKKEVGKRLHPERNTNPDNKLVYLFGAFIDDKRVSEKRKKVYEGVLGALERYEAYKKTTNKDYSLTVVSFTDEVLADFASFLRAGVRKRQVSENYIAHQLKVLRAFWTWLTEKGLTDTSPFKKYNIAAPSYGTPYYLNKEERNALYAFDLSANASLAKVRDIFIFQCYVGCRMGDLFSLTPDNIIDGHLEYIPRKTKDGRSITVRVPLGRTPLEIIQKYKGTVEDGRLLPFPAMSTYNIYLKEVFNLCGLTERKVTIINPVTQQEEHRPLNEIVSSHLARRTFIALLYKEVKDPNLIGSMSGHREGSTAFSRYRTIDDEVKREVIGLLD